MKKRILSYVLAISVVLSLVTVVPVLAEGEKVLTETEAIIHLKNLGILDGFSSYTDESIVTRAEFSALTVRLLNMTEYIGKSYEAVYSDVFDDYAYKNEIYYCTDYGLLSGMGNGNFMPNAPIETNHVLKVIVKALGYEHEAQANGGYPTGYYFTANRLGLLKGADLTKEGITLKDITKILYNALFVDIMKVTGIKDNENIYSFEKGKNLLTENFKLNFVKGVVDGIYGLSYGISDNLDMDEISVDGMVLKAPQDYAEYFGFNVCVLYSIEELKLGEIVSISENSEKNSAQIIDFYDITGGNTSSFTYETEKEDVSEKISFEDIIIYNRTQVMDYNFGMIDKTKNGNVKLIDNDGDGKKEIVIISEYETYITENVTEEKITERFGKPGIEIDDPDKMLLIKDGEGNRLSLASIARNTVLLVIKTSEFIEITVSNKSIEGVLESFGDDEFVIGGISYKVSPAIDNKKPELGETYKIYFDAYDRIVMVELVPKDGYTFGYLVKLKEPVHDEGSAWVKIFSVDGKHNQYEISDKVIVNGTKYFPYEFASMEAEFYVNNAFTPQLIKYKENEEGKLLEMKTAQDFMSSTEDGFVKGVGEVMDGTNLTYEGVNPNFSGKIFVTAQTKMFLVPPSAEISKAADDDYQIVTSSQLLDNSKYNVTGYYSSRQNFHADTAVIFSLPENFRVLQNTTLASVFVRKFTGVDQEGYPTERYEFFTEDGLVSFSKDCADELVADLKKGDVVRIITASDKLCKLEVIYRHQDGKFPSDGESKIYNTSIRYVKGLVSYLNDNYLRLSYDGSVYDDSTVLNMEGFVMTGNILYITVENTNGNYKIYSGTIDDIEKGSSLVIQQYNGQVKSVVIYK